MEIQIDSFLIKESALELLEAKRQNHTGQSYIIKVWDSHYESYHTVRLIYKWWYNPYSIFVLVGHGNYSFHLTNGIVELL